MKNIVKIALVVIVIILLVLAFFRFKNGPTKNLEVVMPAYENLTYTIDGQPVTLVNGKSATAQYFGNEAIGDLNGDGLPDVAFIFTDNPGGSGTFYYVAVALKTASGYQGTNAVLLGDRIAPQTTEIKNGQLIVNYADSKPTDSMVTPPSVGVSKYLKVQGTSLVVL